MKSPGFPVRSTTLTDASLTYKQSVNLEISKDVLLNLGAFAANNGQHHSNHCDRGLHLVAGTKAVGEEDSMLLLTGQCNEEVQIRDYDMASRPMDRLRYLQELVAAWRKQFKTQNFASLVPTQKWQEEKRGFRFNDIIPLSYETKSKEKFYKLRTVVQVEPEGDGLMHTVRITHSLLRELLKAKRAEVKKVTKKMIRAPVQELMLNVPVEEQGGNVHVPTPSNDRGGTNKGRGRDATRQGCLPPSVAEGDYKNNGPGILVHLTKVHGAKYRALCSLVT